VGRYKTDLMPDNLSFTKQTIRIGVVKYRKCVTFRAFEPGLFLEIKVPLWKTRKILIPWKDLKHTGYTKIYWQSAASLMVAEDHIATIAIPIQLFYLMEPFIKD
jgi:hypothetical protein